MFKDASSLDPLLKVGSSEDRSKSDSSDSTNDSENEKRSLSPPIAVTPEKMKPTTLRPASCNFAAQKKHVRRASSPYNWVNQNKEKSQLSERVPVCLVF